MPIPSPRKGQSKNAFISQCMHAIGNEYEDKKQAVAICFSKWQDKKAKAAYVLQANGDEVIFTQSSLLLPESLIAKLKNLPASGQDYHYVKLTLRDGTTRAGIVNNGQDFETSTDMEDVIADDVVDLVMDD